MKIAIVGAGISGLTAAHFLHREHEITVFEAASYAGGHTNTIEVDDDGSSLAVDTGFIIFNETHYPNFCRLLGELGVSHQPTSMSFSVRCDRRGIEYNGTSLNALFAQRSNLLRPSFHRMIRDILRFGREAVSILDRADESMTVGDYLEEGGYSREFAELYLVPMGSSLWSAPPETFRRFPIRFLVEFMANHALLRVNGRPTWQVIKGGSRRYVERLIAPFEDRIRLNTPIASISRHGGPGQGGPRHAGTAPGGSHPGGMRQAGQVTVVPADGSGAEQFDHVIIGCHADQALRMLADPTPVERELLSAFPYQPNEAVLHTDTSVLPRRRLAWASWNYHVRRDDPGVAAVTYNMNMLQSLKSRRVFCVTLNDDDGIDPSKIIRRIAYHHPIYTTGRAQAQRRHGEVIGANHTSFCGAYWGYGFHEDGVNSGLAVAALLAERLAA